MTTCRENSMRLVDDSASVFVSRLELGGRSRRFVGLRLLLGILLISAMVLKSYQLLSGSEIVEGGHLPEVVEWVLVALELILGIWLLCGFRLRAAWVLASCLFAAFSSYSLLLVLRNQPSCGCFGSVELSPRVMLPVDLIIVLALLLYQPELSGMSNNQPEETCPGQFDDGSRRSVLRCRRVLPGLFCLSIALGILAGWATAERAPDVVGPTRSSGFFSANHDKSEGGYYPLLWHVDIGARIERGE